jgi:hypothetical protein
MSNPMYIFGYGSLINFSSIEKTLFSIGDDEEDIEFLKKNIVCCSPILEKALKFDKIIQVVRVKNLKRGWYLRYGSYDNKITQGHITLGAYESKSSTCNGTLFPVTKAQLENIDLRESKYIRKIIKNTDIEFLKGNGLEKNAIVYYYSIDKYKIKTPNNLFPLLQSYIDICMTGCILIDKLLENTNFEYTNEFVSTTYEWKNYKYWINDRIYPRRPSVFTPYAKIIDNIITNKIIN